MHRKLALLSMPLVLGLAIGACGEGDDEKEASRAVLAAFELTGSGDKAKMSGPKSLEAGVVRVSFRNATDDNGGVTLIRVQGGHTAAEAVRAGEAWGDGRKPLPEWVRFVGGVAEVQQPGRSVTSVQNLSAGTYAAVDIGTNAYVGFEVTGEGDGDLPTTSGRIEAKDYSFKTIGLKAGKSRILFTNEGKQPHFALAVPIKPGKTIEDVREALKEEEGGGEPPVIEKESVSSGILDGGERQVVDLTLRKGKYALVCFVANRTGGPPHAFLGMVSEGIVE